MRFEKMDVEESDVGAENENNATPSRENLERKNCYRNLLNAVEEIEENKDLGLQTVNSLGNILKEINELEKEYSIEERVDQTNETLLDCMVLSSTSKVLVQCLKAVDISQVNYEATEFCEKLRHQLKNEEEEYRPSDILKLLLEARNVIPEISSYEFVYGSYDINKIPEPKQKKVVKRNPKEKLTKKEPEKIQTLEKEEEEIGEIVKGLYQVLLDEYIKNGKEPINYYDYVIDTSNFSNTIENMFYCSFLVRNGQAKIDLADGKNPTITPMSKNDLKTFRDNRGANYQIITSITMNDWQGFTKEGFLQRHKRMSKRGKK